MDSGFGDDEAYNVYDKPWRSDKDAASHIYRPSRNKDNDTHTGMISMNSLKQTG